MKRHNRIVVALAAAVCFGPAEAQTSAGYALSFDGTNAFVEITHVSVLDAFPGWTRKSVTNLSAGSFSLVSAGFPNFLNDSVHPDFSAAGPPVQFGFFPGNSNPGTRDGGIDNWNVTVFAPAANSFAFVRLAGSGTPGTKDGVGAAAQFGKMRDVAVDAIGNVFVADTSNNTIRRITPRGVVSTIAGMAGQSGISDGIGAVARFNGPQGIAVDREGTVFVADITGKIIRKLTPTTPSGEKDWRVETIAGSGNAAGSQDGTGRQARFFGPRGIAIDAAGNLYITEFSNNTIRKISPHGADWVVSTVAGLALSAGSRDGTNNFARFNQPTGIAVDSDTNLYVADLGNNSIRRIAPNGADWIVSTIAGTTAAGFADGEGTTARFTQPNGIALAADGAFYVPESGNGTIRRLARRDKTWIVSTVAGLAGATGFEDGSGSSVRFYHPVGVACDSQGNVYIGDIDNYAVRKGWAAGTQVLGKFDQFRFTSTAAVLDFTIMTGSVTNLILLRSDTITGPWTADSTAKISPMIRNISYEITVPLTGSGSGFFRGELE